jgi:microcystin-dependent protein
LPLETATYISDLVTANPAHTDGLSQADSHMRLLKATLKATFPNVAGVASISHTQLSAFTGDGSSSLPAYSFISSEPSLGFYRPSAGIIAFTGTLVGQGAVPAGSIMDFAMATAPAGWIPCDGAVISRTTYFNLFAAIGTTWGAGDGSTTFAIPNFISRFRRHRDNSFLSGAVGNLQSPSNLTHTHGVVGSTGAEDTAHSHAYSGTTGVDSPDHAHTTTVTGVLNGGGAAIGGGGSYYGPSPVAYASGGASARHAHAFSGQTGTESAAHAHAINLTSAASGDANESRPYSATVLTCIKV